MSVEQIRDILRRQLSEEESAVVEEGETVSENQQDIPQEQPQQDMPQQVQPTSTYEESRNMIRERLRQRLVVEESHEEEQIEEQRQQRQPQIQEYEPPSPLNGEEEIVEERKVLTDEDVISQVLGELETKQHIEEVKTRSEYLNSLRRISSQGRNAYSRKVYSLEGDKLISQEVYKDMGLISNRESINKLRGDITTNLSGLETELIPKLSSVEYYRYIPEVFSVEKSRTGATIRISTSTLFTFTDFCRENNLPDIKVTQPRGVFEVVIQNNTIQSVKVYKSLMAIYDMNSPLLQFVAEYTDIGQTYNGTSIQFIDDLRNVATTQLLDFENEDRTEEIKGIIREGNISHVGFK